MGIILSLLPASGCSKDDDADGAFGGYTLIVNGKKWDAGITCPVYEGDSFYFICNTPDGQGHALRFVEDLTREDLRVGDDVSPEYLLLPTENAQYQYASGSVIVEKRTQTTVTLKFDNYKVRYIGDWISNAGDSRSPDIEDAEYLTIKGTVTFTDRSSIHS